MQVCIPDWPFYNNNKVEWLDEIPDHTANWKASHKKKAGPGKEDKPAAAATAPYTAPVH